MKNSSRLAGSAVRLLALVCLPLFLGVSFGADHQYKHIETLETANSAADCFYFTLAGVAQADPSIPNTPWFAIPRSQFGAKDAMATLLAAKLTGVPIRVITSGQIACGHAQVHVVQLQ